MNNLELFKTITIKSTGYVIPYTTNPFYKYCIKNNLVTVWDMLELVRKQVRNNNCEYFTAIMFGIIKLCAYKYCDIDIKINQQLDYKITNNKVKYKNLFSIGLLYSDIKLLYKFANNYSTIGKSIIEYIKEFVNEKPEYLPSDTINKYKTFIDYYDEYNNVNIRSKG